MVQLFDSFSDQQDTRFADRSAAEDTSSSTVADSGASRTSMAVNLPNSSTVVSLAGSLGSSSGSSTGSLFDSLVQSSDSCWPAFCRCSSRSPAASAR